MRTTGAMAPTLSSLLPVGLVSMLWLVSCDILLGIEPSTRRDDARVGHDGNGGSRPEQGGGGSGGTTGAAGGAGETAGGEAGAPDAAGGAESSGGSGPISGTGGTAGEGTTGPRPPELGEPCGQEGARACAASRQELVLQCRDGAWGLYAACLELQRCSPQSTGCADIARDCFENPEGLCLGGTGLVDCRSDPFAPPERTCPFGCASGTCLPGTGDQLIVHTEPHPPAIAPWNGNIPICFASDPGPSLRDWVRSAVEQNWARYLDITFLGWGDCESEGAQGMVLDFLSECRQRIADAVVLGHPQSTDQVRLGICRSYFDAGGTLRELEQNEDLARFVAVHQVGHGLGLGEVFVDDETPTVMIRGVRASLASSDVWAEDVRALSAYGYKPEASVVSVAGWCLDSAGARASAVRCSRTPTQRFRAFPDRVEVDGNQQCLVVEGDPPNATVEVDGCTLPPPPNALALRRARWGAPGYCVEPRTLPVVPGTPLVTAPCREIGDAAQTWSFEITGVEAGRPRARLRFIAQDYCLSVPPTANPLFHVPTLEPCAPGSTVFELEPNGEVSLTMGTTRACLDWIDGSVVYLAGCNGRPWMLTGPLETADGRAARAPNEPGSDLTVVALEPGEPPGHAEVFDVHF